jgi:hypothetical protein
MILNLTNDQAHELWVSLRLRVDTLERETQTHPQMITRGIATRQLNRILPVFQTLNAYIEANTPEDDDHDDGNYHPYGDPQI